MVRLEDKSDQFIEQDQDTKKWIDFTKRFFGDEFSISGTLSNVLVLKPNEGPICTIDYVDAQALLPKTLSEKYHSTLNELCEAYEKEFNSVREFQITLV